MVTFVELLALGQILSIPLTADAADLIEGKSLGQISYNVRTDGAGFKGLARRDAGAL